MVSLVSSCNGLRVMCDVLSSAWTDAGDAALPLSTVIPAPCSLHTIHSSHSPKVTVKRVSRPCQPIRGLAGQTLANKRADGDIITSLHQTEP